MPGAHGGGGLPPVTSLGHFSQSAPPHGPGSGSGSAPPHNRPHAASSLQSLTHAPPQAYLHTPAPQPGSPGAFSSELPAPPPQWQGYDDNNMRAWLAVKAEEEKRRQEREKTQQEMHRLERRRLEFDMLRMMFAEGVAPSAVPAIFAAVGDGTPAGSAPDWPQQPPGSSSSRGQSQHAGTSAGAGSEPGHHRDSGSRSWLGGQPLQTTMPTTPSTAMTPYHHHRPDSPARFHDQQSAAPGRSLPSISGLQTPLATTHAGAHPQGGLPPLVALSQTQQQHHQQPPPPQHHEAQQMVFHHWQPPTTQGPSYHHPPSTPSGSSKAKRRKSDSIGG